jgi:serine/threonine protein kinase
MNIGDVIEGRYRIEQLLGEGGMGSVFLAHDLTLNKKVAIKTLLPRMLSDLKSIEQLRKEVRISQELRHENICATYDLHESKSQPFMVMEYVEGETLVNYLFRLPGHRCDEKTFHKLADQILEAMDYAHRRGVIHRDLKSANIMVTAAGEIRIMDFGIAASLKEASSRTTGTPISLSIHYASPEQINGEPPSISMDIYSLGCVFYEMLSGDPPFHQGDILHQHLTKEPLDIAGISPTLNEAILACLIKDRRKRLQSAFEIGVALDGNKTIQISKGYTASAKVVLRIPKEPENKGRPITVQNWLPLIWLAVAILVVLGIILISPEFKRGRFAPTRNAEKSLEQMLNQAERAYQDAQYDQAIEGFNAVLALDSRNEEAQRGRTKAQSAKNAEAGFSREEETTDDWLRKGDQLFQEAKYQEAIDCYRKALELDPQNAIAIRGLDRVNKARAAEESIRQ